MKSILPTLVAIISLTSATAILERQVDCSAYGEYPEYTGPCESTNCGARAVNCDETGWSGCVIYPAFGCPAQGCACTNY